MHNVNHFWEEDLTSVKCRKQEILLLFWPQDKYFTHISNIKALLQETTDILLVENVSNSFSTMSWFSLAAQETFWPLNTFFRQQCWNYSTQNLSFFEFIGAVSEYRTAWIQVPSILHTLRLFRPVDEMTAISLLYFYFFISILF